MIHKIFKFGKSFKGRVNYIFGMGRHAHDHKVESCDLINFSGLVPPKSMAFSKGSSFSDSDLSEISDQFQSFARLYVPRTNSEPMPVFHAVLSLEPGDRLNTEQWDVAVHQYMAAIGFSAAQFIAVRHLDVDHEHVHIVANRVVKTASGFRLISSSKDRAKGMAAMRKLEREFGLSLVADPENTWQVSYSQREVRCALATSSPPWRGQLLQLVAAAAEGARGGSWTKFIRGCESLGVTVSTRFDRDNRPVGVSFGYGGRCISGRKLKASRCSFQKLTSVGGIDYEAERDFSSAEAANARHAVARPANFAHEGGWRGSYKEQRGKFSGFEGTTFIIQARVTGSQLKRIERHQLRIYQSRYFEDRAVVWLRFKVPFCGIAQEMRAGEFQLPLEAIENLVRLFVAVLLGIFGVAMHVSRTAVNLVQSINPLDLTGAPRLSLDSKSHRDCAQYLLARNGYSVTGSELLEGVSQSLMNERRLDYGTTAGKGLNH